MRKDLAKRVSALIHIRIIIVTILLGSFYIFIGYENLSHPAVFSYFIASLYLLTIFYALILPRLRKLTQFIIFAYAQIVIDVTAETVLLYLTQGIESMFSFLFPLSILSAGIVLSRRACYVFATLSSICYGLLLDLQFYNIILTPSSVTFTEKDFFYNIFAHIVAFYLIAFLSGYLSDKLEKATESLQERDTVLSDLKVFSEYIIESMPSGVFTTDLNGRIITFNSSAQDITKLGHKDVIGKKPDDVFPFLVKLQGPFKRIEGEMQLNGKTSLIGMRLTTLRDSAGESIGQLGVFQDLTELKAMEAEVKRKERWAFIGELSASIAHELRNPLASLKASVEMLRENKVSKEHADQLMNIALSEMNRLNGIITDFLLYAKPQELNKKMFDLHQSLRDVITLLKSKEANRADIEISTKLDGSAFITGDAKQMRQVFWNLGLNAVDAVNDGGSVEIYTEKKNNTVEVIFEDTGYGISTADVDRIFYPFFTTKEKGTGLGLAIARKIIEEHSGKILVESGGKETRTTFKVILPANNA